MGDFGLPLDQNPIDPAIMPDDPLDQIPQDQSQQNSPEIKNSSDNPVDNDDIPHALKTIRDIIERTERHVREVLIRQWKLQQLFWQGIQRIIWNEEMQDLRSIEYLENIPDDLPVDISDYGKVVNIYRGYGEAIAGALTT